MSFKKTVSMPYTAGNYPKEFTVEAHTEGRAYDERYINLIGRCQKTGASYGLNISPTLAEELAGALIDAVKAMRLASIPGYYNLPPVRPNPNPVAAAAKAYQAYQDAQKAANEVNPTPAGARWETITGSNTLTQRLRVPGGWFYQFFVSQP